MRKYVCFFLGEQEFAAPIEAVRETVGLKPITPVFRTPPCVAGITNLRGDILAVLDVAVMIGLPPCRRDPGSRILIVEPDERCAGFLVEGLGSIRDIADEDLGPVPPTIPQAVATMLRAVVSLPERPVGILDLDRVLGSPELAPFAPPGRNTGLAHTAVEGG